MVNGAQHSLKRWTRASRVAPATPMGAVRTSLRNAETESGKIAR
jgi:hypothetical protein